MIQISSQSIPSLEASVTLGLLSFQHYSPVLGAFSSKQQWEVATGQVLQGFICFSIPDLEQAQLSLHYTPIHNVTITFTDLPEFLSQNQKEKKNRIDEMTEVS